MVFMIGLVEVRAAPTDIKNETTRGTTSLLKTALRIEAHPSTANVFIAINA
jgi:hypothetical protein